MLVRTASARRRADDDRVTCRERVFAGLDPDELPRLAQVADGWATLTDEDTYLDGLRALVDGPPHPLRRTRRSPAPPERRWG
jgi:hypothetical protein